MPYPSRFRQSLVFPDGMYHIGDPCHAFDESWPNLASKIVGVDRGVELVSFPRMNVWCARVACENGTYVDGNGFEYPVISGGFGLVQCAADDCDPGSSMRLVEVEGLGEVVLVDDNAVVGVLGVVGGDVYTRVV